MKIKMQLSAVTIKVFVTLLLVAGGAVSLSLISQVLTFAPVTAQTNQTVTVTYTGNNENFPNPERGFYSQTLSDSASPSPLSSYQFQQLKNNKMTLLRRLYSMTTFRNSAISQSYLNHIQNDFNLARNNRVKLIVRFAYTFNEAGAHQDASLTVIKQHIDQLQPLLQQNADVIAYMEAGFIGRWGEWHTSSNGLDNNAARKEVLFKLLSALPASRTVAVRVQSYKKYSFETNEPMPDSQAFSGTYRARTAHFNDCFLADTDDWGTYWPFDEANLKSQKDYLRSENRFLPQGGETCNYNPPRTECETALAELAGMRWSALNLDYHEDVLNNWRTKGCFQEVEKRLGYRFRLIQATMPSQAGVGNSLAMSFVIRNDGWASPYNQRLVEIVLRNQQSGVKHKIAVNTDPRRWLPENGEILINVNAALPADLPTGEYDVLLNLPDAVPSLSDKPEYSIRLANQNVWEVETGYNKLLHTITITNGGGNTLITLNPVNASFVRDGQFASDNYGSNTQLLVKKSSAGFNRWSYIKFDLSNVTQVNTAKLRLLGNLSDAQNTNVQTAVYPSADVSWTGESLTWNNKPTSGTTALASATVTDSTARWYEWDVSSYLKAEKAAGRSYATFVLKNTTTTNTITQFNSDNAASNKPELVISQLP